MPNPLLVPALSILLVIVPGFSRTAWAIAEEDDVKPERPASKVVGAPPPTWVPRFGVRRGGEVTFMDVKDGFLVWLERKLDQRTAQFRAPVYDCALFRAKLPDEQAELVLVDRVSGFPRYVVGSEGAIVVGHGKNTDLYLKGHPPERFNLPNGFGRDFAPVAIYPDFWICRIFGDLKKSVVYIPAEGFQPIVARHRVLASTPEWGFLDVSPDQLAWNDTLLLYPSRQGFHSFSLWDPAKEKAVATFTLQGRPLKIVAMDRRYVFALRHLKTYVRPPPPFADPLELVRYKLDAPHEMDRAEMARSLGRLYAFDPPYLIAMFQSDQGALLYEINLRTLEATHSAPLPRFPKHIHADLPRHCLYAADTSTIYRVPLAPLEEPVDFLEWKPVEPTEID